MRGLPEKWMHAHDELINGWLKRDHGFDGFVMGKVKAKTVTPIKA